LVVLWNLLLRRIDIMLLKYDINIDTDAIKANLGRLTN
jgi:hypothetical protein